MTDTQNEFDRECLWTYERMMGKTAPYCHWFSAYCEPIKTYVEGWFMTDLALDDVVKYEWPN